MKTKIELSGKYLIARRNTENLSKGYVYLFHLNQIHLETKWKNLLFDSFKTMFVCKCIYLINRNEVHLNELRLNAAYEIPF